MEVKLRNPIVLVREKEKVVAPQEIQTSQKPKRIKTDGKRLEKVFITLKGGSNEVKILTPIPYDLDDWDPHLYYDKWEEQHKKRTDLAASINTIVDFVSAMGINFRGDTDKDQKTWNEWAEENEFEQTMRQVMHNTLLFGNGSAHIIKDPYDKTKLILQTFHPAEVYPLLVNRRIRGYYITKFGAAGISIWVAGKYRKPPNVLETIQGEDFKRFMSFEINKIGVSAYGMALGTQAYDVIEEKLALLKIGYVMAFRATHGLLIATVDTTNLSDTEITEGENKGKTQRELWLDGVVNTLADAVQVDTAGNYTIANNFAFPEHVTVTSLEIKNDLTGLTKMIETVNNEVCRTLKVPRIFLNETEGTNRSTSQTVDSGFNTLLLSVWKEMVSPLYKLKRALGIKGKFYYNEISREVFNTLILSATRVWFGWQIGFLSGEQTMEMTNKLLNTNWEYDESQMVAQPPAAVPGSQASPNKMRYGRDENMIPAQLANIISPPTAQHPTINLQAYNEGVWRELRVKYSPKVGHIISKYKSIYTTHFMEFANEKWEELQAKAEEAGIKLQDSVEVMNIQNEMDFSDPELSTLMLTNEQEAWTNEAERKGIEITWGTDTTAWLESDITRYGVEIAARLGFEVLHDMDEYLRIATEVEGAELQNIMAGPYTRYNTTQLANDQTYNGADALGLEALRQQGVQRVFLLPAFRATCPECLAMFRDTMASNGIPIEDAMRILKIHVLCECTWIPWSEGEALLGGVA